MRIVDAAGKRISGFGTKVFVELTGGRYVTIGRSALSRLLFETVKGGTETIFGDEIVALDERQDHVAVRLKSGGERRFDLVIGADGLHSAVRRLAFGPQDRFEKRLGYVVAVVRSGAATGRAMRMSTSPTANPAAWSGACRCATTKR